MTLTGDASRRRHLQITVDARGITPGVTAFRSWSCTSLNIAPGGPADLMFAADDPVPSIRDASGTAASRWRIR